MNKTITDRKPVVKMNKADIEEVIDQANILHLIDCIAESKFELNRKHFASQLKEALNNKGVITNVAIALSQGASL